MKTKQLFRMKAHVLFSVLSLVSPLRAAATTFRPATTDHRRGHSDPPEHSTTQAVHISDHRFFLHEIFTKYGHGGQMTFEGFEHLLESLGLGNIIINDHDVMAHKEDSFQKMHETHDHSKKVDDHASKKMTKDHRHVSHTTAQYRVQQSTTDLSYDAMTKTYTDDDGHKSNLNVNPTATSSKFERILPPTQNHLIHNKQSVHPSSYNHIQHHPTTPDDPMTAKSSDANSNLDSSEHIYHYQVRDEDIPELLVNLSSLVDQHQELENHGPEIIIEQCLSPKEILETFGINQTSSLNPVSFLHLCPAIIYELDQGHCMFRSHAHRKPSGAVTMDQWMYSCLAVVVISLCGLLSVAVIPIMQKWFYHTLLQFLVGLAIGSLSGDALLHLMPHAMLGGEGAHSHDSSIAADSAEKTAIWRGFAALGGIFFFFIAERLLGALTVARKQKKEEDAKMFQAVFSNNLSDEISHGIVGKKLSHYKRNSTDLVGNEKELAQMLKPESYMVPEYKFHDPSNYPTKEKMDVVLNSTSETKVAVTEHKGHGHGHSHEVPQSVSAVAWMVIMGDGLHNFCDGLAIGAAFASGVEGGISTSVAVFCHELPHELGDFAMLLKTGMKVKQALFYNLLSSVLCFVGMVIGVSLGNVHSATSWVFAATAGMFLYIALVDMLPELSSVPQEQSSVAYQLAVQVLGISTGISIMLLIANYEQDLQAIIS